MELDKIQAAELHNPSDPFAVIHETPTRQILSGNFPLISLARSGVT
jgi:hypothetical protein